MLYIIRVFLLDLRVVTVHIMLFVSVFSLWSILVLWSESRFLDTVVDGSNPGISMLLL